MMTIDARQALTELAAMLSRTTNMAPVLSAIGQMQRAKIQARIRDTKIDPDGGPWAPWAPATRAYREGKGNAGQGLLWDTGNLLNNIEVNADPMKVVIGTAVEYGLFLQSGTGRMPARAYMG